MVSKRDELCRMEDESGGMTEAKSGGMHKLQATLVRCLYCNWNEIVLRKQRTVLLELRKMRSIERLGYPILSRTSNTVRQWLILRLEVQCILHRFDVLLRRHYPTSLFRDCRFSNDGELVPDGLLDGLTKHTTLCHLLWAAGVMAPFLFLPTSTMTILSRR